jgi:hypothetical protein
MAIKKNQNRQAPSVAMASFAAGDFESGVAGVAVDLPSGAIVTGGSFVVDEVFNSGTSDTFTVGDSLVGNRYKAGINGAALGATALVPTGVEVVSATGAVSLTWTGVGAAPTTGKGRLIVEYIISNRGDYIQR